MKKFLLVPVLALTLVFSGCSAAWVSTFDSILAAAAPALINILQIVAVANGKPFNAGLAAKVNADAASLKSLASDFATASASAAPGVCSQLQAALGVYSQDQTQILAVAQVSDQAAETKILLLTGLVSGTIQAVTAVVPSCQTAAKGFKASPPLSVSTFVSHYNSVLTAKTGNAQVDALTPTLKLHQHSKAARIASLGLLK